MTFRKLTMAAVILAAISCIKESDFTPVTESGQEENCLMTKLTGNVSGEFIDGCLLLYLDEETTERYENGEDIAEELFGKAEYISFEKALSHKPKNEEVARELGLHRWFIVTFDEDTPIRSFAENVAVHPEIRAIQFNSVPKLASDCKSIPFRPQTRLNSSPASRSIPFNDPMSSYQWNLNNTGDKNVAATAREGADAGVIDAWKLTAGTPDVIVAVCDAPVKYTHPDLAGSMWVNEAELNGVKGVDDDGNDYIDDIHGYNFYKRGGSNGAINWETETESGHGTHVAGIVAAVNGNGIGVSSVAGGSGKGDGVRLMCCQVFEGIYSDGDRGMSEALMYAADNGACIVQCSYGYPAGTFECDDAFIENASLEYRALKYFTNPKNCNHPSLEANVAIFAAGNESASISGYPGALPMCISVTAFGPDFLPAGYTNYGRGCNIAAPGGDLWVGAPKEEDNISQILSTGLSEISGDYIWMQGSSMACPHVSGVAALGVSYAGMLGKKFTDNEFKTMLLTSVNDINQYMTEGGKSFKDMWINMQTYHNRMGTGAIDAWKLLMQIEGTPSAMVQTGKKTQVDLSEYFGEGAADLTYLGVEVDEEAKKTLGLASNPKITDGILDIVCMKTGSAKIRISAIAGGVQLGGGSNIGGTEIIREISIISRGVHSANGGWF